MKKKIITFILTIIILILACTVLFKFNKSNNNLKKVEVAEVAHSIFYAPQYAAINNGYFKDEGLDIELILTPGADKVTAAVLSGDVDIGFSGSEATIYVYNGGEKDYLKTFAQLTQKDGSFIVSRKKIDNFTLNDLKGKTIIGGRAGGMPEMTLEWALKENGINPKKDLTIDTSIAFAAMGGSFISGNGDFVTLFEPTALEIEKQGYGYVVASVGSLGGIVPYTSYSAKMSYINNNKDIINKFTKAIQKGLDFVNNNDSDKIAKSIIDFFPDTSLDDLTKVVERYKSQETWPKTTEFTKKSFNHLQEIMISAGELDKAVSYDELISISNLKKIYHDDKSETVAIDNIDLKIKNKEFVSIVGPSGCGKSTLLSILSGLEEKSNGNIILDKNLKIGYMLQKDSLFPWKTIYENCLVGLEVNNLLNDKSKKRVKMLLETYGLKDFMYKYPDSLSGGMRQRVALIRTLATNPDILLLDEPFSALDYMTRIALSEDVYKIIKNEGKTAIMVTHDIAEVMFKKSITVFRHNCYIQ